MTFEIVSAPDLPFDAQAEIFNRAFAGYLAAGVASTSAVWRN